MNSRDEKYPEETLDPTDWGATRALAHRMLDDMLDYLRTLRERPVWQPLPDAEREALRQPLPLEPEGATQAYDEFARLCLP